MAITVTADILYAVAGHREGEQNSIIPDIAPIITVLAPVADLSTNERMWNFLGQSCEESDGFCTMREYASGAAYEGRADLGNTEPGDGIRFAGRGLIETTGRANYRRLTEWCHAGPFPDAPDFEAEPEKLQEPRWAVVSALAYWIMHGLNRYADKGDIRGLTRAINGGLNGLNTRVLYTSRARDALTGPNLSDAPPAPATTILKFGSSGPAVRQLQADLVKSGSQIVVDGRFGYETAKALKLFQEQHGLRPDGIAGPITMKALQAAIQEK